MISAVLIILAACDKEDKGFVPPVKKVLKVVTLPPSDITENSVTLNGELLSLGETELDSVRFSYWEQGNMGTRVSVKADVSEGGKFSKTLTELKSFKDYAYSATAVDQEGHVESDIYSFSTLISAGIGKPEIETTKFDSLTFNAASVFGKLINDGNSENTRVSIVYWKQGFPNLQEYANVEMKEDGTFHGKLKGLLPAQAYEFNCVAQNELEIAQGEPQSFTTTSTIYVDVTAPAGGNGSSWEKALTSVNDAMEIAEENVDVWVAAKGVYFNRNIRLKKNIDLYGGFEGTESSLNERKPNLRTVLDGTHENPNVNNNNNQIMNMWASKREDKCVVDGFVLQNGTGQRAGALFLGKGSPEFKNVVFQNNLGKWGSCVHMYHNDAKFIDCVFKDNISEMGAVHSGKSVTMNTIFQKCHFLRNEATIRGGALFIKGNIVVRSCIFEDNIGKNSAAAIFISGSGPRYEGNNVLKGNNVSGDGSMCAGSNTYCPEDW
ncbi:hypothetical protein FUAX_23490 [Fulvitalea axinellae]|uniref:Fibronectin type-III domain-containing protein n=2 Tax=Fulvitalea axinellae TaxID=1182444 RepID=A0AAU9CSH8_9BACT|nr:hypothetical protein FUAX_23490 [Fulvitalea axinellae]